MNRRGFTLSGPCPLADVGLVLRDDCSRCAPTEAGEPEGTPLARGEILYLEGDEARCLFLVVSGLLREARVQEDGRSQGIRLVRPGELCGAEAFTRDAYQCSVDAVTDARVCRVPIDTVRAVAATSPEQALTLIETLAREVQALRDQVVLLGSLTAEERVRTFLRILTADTEPGAWTRLPLTRAELAVLAGLTQATVSRVFQRLARRGELSVRGRWVRVDNPSALQANP